MMTKRNLTAYITLTCLTILSLTLSNSLQVYAGAWESHADHTWTYKEGDKKLTGWHWIDGNSDGTAECYYMDSEGTLKTSTSIDGWEVNADGAWVQDGVIQTKIVTPGAHYQAGSIASMAAPAGQGAYSTAGSQQSSAGIAGSTVYTPERARSEAVSMTAKGANAPYHGKVWTWDDYYTSTYYKKDGQISITKKCGASGCCNPKNDNGSYCDLHTCKEPGCTLGVSMSEYNAGYCIYHMQAHGIDGQKLASEDRTRRSMEYSAKVNAEREATEKARAARAAAAQSSSSSSSGSKSSGKSSGSSSYRSSGSYSSGSYSTSYDDEEDDLDAYDACYDDIDFNESYDEDRYWDDWDYMSGVDDAMEDYDEDW